MEMVETLKLAFFFFSSSQLCHEKKVQQNYYALQVRFFFSFARFRYLTQ